MNIFYLFTAMFCHYTFLKDIKRQNSSSLIWYIDPRKQASLILSVQMGLLFFMDNLILVCPDNFMNNLFLDKSHGCIYQLVLENWQ